ncbi:MAG: ribonuclease III [Woeseia sp.]
MDKAAAWLKKSLDYEFSEPKLLEAALTHRSAAGASNERLEFLGDAVLGFVISHAVYSQRPDATEGDLSRLRSSLVKDVSLAKLADTLGLGDHILLGSGEKKTGGNRRASIQADALEALFGAICLDRGFSAAEKVILHVFRERLADLPHSDDLKDPKTRLQELLQAEGHNLPDYRVAAVTGEQHRQMFEVQCRVRELNLDTSGNGTSRRGAEQRAASAMLERLRDRARDVSS